MTSECCSCEQERPIYSRGLCMTCYHRHRDWGSLEEFGYLKADRVSDYAALRAAGVSIGRAAARLGVASRTADRYEAELVAAGKAPWRRVARPGEWPVSRRAAA